MRYRIGTVEIDCTDLLTATDLVAQWAKYQPNGQYVCVTGLHGITESSTDDDISEAHNRASLVVPDGVPVVAWGRRKGLPVQQVRGSDLMRALLGRAESTGIRTYLYGSTPATLTRLRNMIERQFPRLEIVGSMSPAIGPILASGVIEHCADIRKTGATLAFIGLSTPKQELWMKMASEEFPGCVYVGVGAAFDFLAGSRKEAPRVLRGSGFEWVYRMACEPRRLSRRYARSGIHLLRLLAAEGGDQLRRSWR